MDVRLPDGTIVTNVPDNITQSELMTRLGRAASAPAPAKPEDSVGALEAAGIAAGRWFDRRAAGLRAAVPEPIRALIDKADTMRGVTPPAIDQPTVNAAEEVYKPLAEKQPLATFAGDLAPNLATINPVSMGLVAATEIGTPAERAARAGMSYGAGKLGEVVGGKLANMLSSKAAGNASDLAAQKAQNAVRDATLAEAQRAGYAIPPTQANPTAPGAVNRLLEGLSGKIQTGQAAAIKNQQVTNMLAKRALSLPDDAPLTRESLQTVRGAAGQVYQAVKGFGQVSADDEFRAAMNGVAGEYKTLAAEFPSQANGTIDSLLKDLSRDQFNSSTIVELVKRLRHDGYKNIAAIEPERRALGQVQLGAQGALEDLLDRRVAAAGDPGALDVFRRARELIAKTYTVQNALEESSGKVVAAKIGKEFSKGRPITGELATIGKTAEAFPKAVQNVNTSMPGLSPLDAAAAAILGTGSGDITMAALPLVRPLVRAGLLSGPYQRAMVKAPDYAPGAMQKLIASGGDNPEVMRRIGGLLGLTGLRAYQ